MFVWQDYFCQLILLFSLFLLQLVDLTVLFGTIHGSHCIIWANFYLYLQYFQQKIFSFSKISKSSMFFNEFMSTAYFILLLLLLLLLLFIIIFLCIGLNHFSWLSHFFFFRWSDLWCQSFSSATCTSSCLLYNLKKLIS